jgi:hypothetical protein
VTFFVDQPTDLGKPMKITIGTGVAKGYGKDALTPTVKPIKSPRPLTALTPDVPSHYKRLGEVRIGQFLVHNNRLYLKIADDKIQHQQMESFKLVKGVKEIISPNQQVIPCYFMKPEKGM